MQIPQLVSILKNSIDSPLNHHQSQSLLNQCQQPGCITNLLIIGDDQQYPISIRQSALVLIKNALISDYNTTINIPENDYEVVKSSILQALIRNCQQKSISPTIKQIIFVLADQQYPNDWQEIIPEIANIIQNSGDFNQLFGSIEALKAIVSAIVQKVDIRLTLNNVCNIIIRPLLSFTGKLFQNYNDTTSYILISIFKIFSTITNFHVPQNVILNIHSWMLFIKKILDLKFQAENIDLNIYSLKKICLRILFRFYQRHLNVKFSQLGKDIIEGFHNKFTKGFTESLFFQIMNEGQLVKNSTNKNFIHLTKYSLACLSYVYEEDRNAAITIDNYKEKIIFLCLQRYTTRLSKNYASYGDFIVKLSQNRTHLCQFINALIRNQSKKDEQVRKGNIGYYNSADVTSILACLYMHIQKGNDEVKELCLYIYSQIASALPEGDNQIQSKMLAFIINVVKPILNQSSAHLILKLRCCELLSHYSNIQIPENQLTELAGGVYSCLVSPNKPDSTSIETYLQIHAVYAFNSLLRFDMIINFTAPHLKIILGVYTSLLEIDVSLIKCLEDMLAKFQSHLQPYGNSLIEMLSELFFKYYNFVRESFNQKGLQKSQKPNKNDEDSDDEQGSLESDNNYLNACKASLATIRQIIQTPEFTLQKQGLIHQILILIFTDKEMLYVEEGFNILNQILFKAKSLNPDYNIYFIQIIYGILPVQNHLIDILKHQNSNFSNTLLQILDCQCNNPDLDFIDNTIGCLRNFIAKYQYSLRSQIDREGRTFLELLLHTVRYVHQNQSEKAKESQRSTILTIYMSLIQWKAFEDREYRQILETVATWLNMQKQACLKKNAERKQQHEPEAKPIYLPIYLEIILLGCHFYPHVTFNFLDGNWIAKELLQNWENFCIDYEIGRLLIGIADMLNSQVITQQVQTVEVMNRLPDAIEILCNMRSGQFENVIENEDDQAMQERFFGMDENTHIMGWRRPNNQQINNQQQQQPQMEDQQESDDQQDQEFNKYYESPLDAIDQVAYIIETLRSPRCEAYMNLMANQQQNKLSQLIANVPPKFNRDQNN